MTVGHNLELRTKNYNQNVLSRTRRQEAAPADVPVNSEEEASPVEVASTVKPTIESPGILPRLNFLIRAWY